jgi:hypothetical protein
MGLLLDTHITSNNVYNVEMKTIRLQNWLGITIERQQASKTG